MTIIPSGQIQHRHRLKLEEGNKGLRMFSSPFIVSMVLISCAQKTLCRGCSHVHLYAQESDESHPIFLRGIVCGKEAVMLIIPVTGEPRPTTFDPGLQLILQIRSIHETPETVFPALLSFHHVFIYQNHIGSFL